MSVKVREIRVPNRDFLQLRDATSGLKDSTQSIASVASLHYALFDGDIAQAMPTCRDYISSISEFPLEGIQKLKGTTSKIVWRLLESILRFLRTNIIASQASVLSS
jgi:hypothetical protein